MRRVLHQLGFFVTFSLAACGGKVVVDLSGTGGSGSSGSLPLPSTGPGSSGSLPLPSTGPGSPTGPGPVGTGGSSVCVEICQLWEQAGCDLKACPEKCDQSFQTAGACIDELNAALQCILDHPGQAKTCMTPKPCIGAFEAYQTCIVPPGCDFKSVSCFASPEGSCGCKGICNGVTLSAECDATTATCQCRENGSPLGTCEEPALTCDLFSGCCSKFFSTN